MGGGKLKVISRAGRALLRTPILMTRISMGGRGSPGGAVTEEGGLGGDREADSASTSTHESPAGSVNEPDSVEPTLGRTRL